MTVDPASGPADWWLRPLRPSDAARGVDRWLLDRTGGGGKDYWTIVGIGGAVLLWAAFQPLVALACLWVGLGFTAVHAARAYRAEPTKRATAAAPFILLLVIGTVLLAVDLPWAATLLGLGTAEALARRPQERAATPVPDRWYSHNTLRDALVRAKVLPALDEGGGPPQLGYRGKLVRNDVGEWQTVDLPAPLTWRDAMKAHERIARSLDLPAERLHLEHEKGKPEGYVTFVVLADRKALPAAPTLPERTDWTQPVSLNTDRLGRPAEFQTVNIHSAIVAATGAGKTALVRLLMSVAGSDPRVPILCINGKDDIEDLEPIRPLCAAYVGGRDRAAVAGAYALLQKVEQIAAYRARIPKSERQPIVLLVDEWYALLGSARRYDKQQAEDMENLFAELAATVRALGIHIVLCLQKGTEHYLSKDMSVNLMQKVVGMCETPNEIRYVVGFQPTAEQMPQEPGQFLIKRPGQEPMLVHVPFLDDQGFAEACARAVRLRADEPHPSLDELAGNSCVEASPKCTALVSEAETDEGWALREAVRQVLKRRGPLRTSHLYDALPEDIRPGGANVLGRELKAMPGVRRVWVDGNRQAWEYERLPLVLPRAVPPDEQPVPLAEAVGAPGYQGHLPLVPGPEAAQGRDTGTGNVVPLVPSVLP